MGEREEEGGQSVLFLIAAPVSEAEDSLHHIVI